MDLRDLEVFRAVVSEGGITRASEKLGRVQSSITARIKQLEQELGVDLFLREGKKMLISPDGRVLLSYAERLLALAAEAKAALRDDVPCGEFSLGAMESTAAVRLPGPLTRFYQRYPEVDLKLRTGNPRQLSTAVMSGELEAALIAEPIAEAQFDSALAFEEKLVLIAPRDYPEIDAKTPSPDTIIVFENGCPHRRQLEAWYQARNDIPSKTIELGSYHAMFGSVVAGMGIALMPASVLAAFPEHDKVSAHPLPEGQNMLRTFVIWRRGVRSPKVQALIDVLN